MEKQEKLIRLVQDLLHDSHGDCLDRPFEGEPLARRDRKHAYATEIIAAAQISLLETILRENIPMPSDAEGAYLTGWRDGVFTLEDRIRARLKELTNNT